MSGGAGGGHFGLLEGELEAACGQEIKQTTVRACYASDVNWRKSKMIAIGGQTQALGS